MKNPNGTRQILGDILQHYSTRTSEVVSSLLNNEKFIQSVQRVLVASLEFRDLLQKSIQTALEQVNVPTRTDIEHLLEGQRALEDRLYALEETLERIEARLSDHDDRPKPRRVRPARAASGHNEEENRA